MLKTKKFWFLLLYAVLLAASFGVRISKAPTSHQSGKFFVNIEPAGTKPVKIAYKESNTNSSKDKLPVIFVHGSPGNADGFDRLTRLLPDRHIISVDLPGFGDSEHNIPDYSILAHAKYLNAFLKQKGIEKAHLAGFSLGGGVVLHLSEIAPEKVASISFISSIGVQEYELFGGYYSNHFVHGLQLVFGWVVTELTPHFGLFDGGMIEYSRNFYDTDQRPLRSLLSKTDKPFLIMHGKDDPLVPVEAAREHARIVPQSEYYELDDGHFFVFMRPEKIAVLIKGFWNKVENGSALTLETSNKQRVVASQKPFVYNIISAKGATLFCLFVLFLVIAFVNDEFAALLAGVFVAQGRIGVILPLIAIISVILISGFVWRRIGRRQRGNSRVYIPYSLESEKGLAFGFRFQDYLNRSRDGFVEYFAQSLGVGLLRIAVVGFGAYLVSFGSVAAGFIDFTSTLYLVLGVLLIYIIAGLFRMKRGNRRR